LLSEAIRNRRRDWRVTAAFCALIGACLGVVVAAFSIAWPILWGPMPFPNQARLAGIRSFAKGAAAGVSWGDAEDLRRLVPSIAKLAVYSARTWGVQTERNGHVDVLQSVMATSEFLDVLGVRPSLGEPMSAAHDTPGAQNEAWLSHASAVKLFGAADGAVHRTLWINAAPYRVAGVLPQSFGFPMPEGEPELLIPLSRADYCCARGVGAQRAIALLKDPLRFDSELRAASAALAAEFPATHAHLHFYPVVLREFLFGGRLTALRWILAGALCLLLIAAANGSGIWMAAWLRTQRDAAIRLSLGASPLRLASVRATEGAAAGFCSGLAGLLVAAALLRTAQAVPSLHDRLDALTAWGPPSMPLAAVFVALAGGTFVGVVAALVPHLALMRRLVREGARGVMLAHYAGARVRLVLTALQLAATATVGWTAIAIGENVQTLLRADRGFQTQHTLIAGIGIPEARYNTDEKITAFHTGVVEQLKAVPGVTAAAGGAAVPQANFRTRFLLDGQSLARDRQPTARIGIATPELLPLLRIGVRRGRGFSSADTWNAPRVALVNEAFVRAHFPDGLDPLHGAVRPSFYNGFAMKPYTRFQIIGIVADTRNDPLLVEPQPQILIPAAQIAMEGFFYFAATALPPEAINAQLREAIWRVDPAIQRVTFQPLDSFLERGLADRRALSTFGMALLLLAILIVGVGLFASLSASLLESTRELAIRAALGATPARLTLHSLGWVFAAFGLAALVTVPLLPVIAAHVQLEKAVLRPTAVNVAAPMLVLVLLTIAAAFVPVRRAASASPGEALRG
jgi:predicted permease